MDSSCSGLSTSFPSSWRSWISGSPVSEAKAAPFTTDQAPAWSPLGASACWWCHHSHWDKGNPQLLLFLQISERFTFSASFTGIACGIKSYADYCKTSVIYFSSVSILPLCALLLKRSINMLLIILMTVSVAVQDDLDMFTVAHDLIYTQLNWWDLQLDHLYVHLYLDSPYIIVVWMKLIF